ncbi:flagellar biosynthetic protein FliR, partial [Streptomyces caeruleatus]
RLAPQVQIAFLGMPLKSLLGLVILFIGFHFLMYQMDQETLLWFKKRYPKWATNFIDTIMKTVADHGPAVSGAHNARVTARAGKDLISCLVT